MTDTVALTSLQAGQLRHELDAARAHAERLQSIVERLVGVHRCVGCGSAYEYCTDISAWRWLDDKWQHKCPGTDPQIGYFDATFFRGSLSLDRDAAEAEAAALREGYAKEGIDVEQTLARALGGFPAYADDQDNFPGATEQDGLCVGEHTPGTLAHIAASEMARMRSEIARLDAACDAKGDTIADMAKAMARLADKHDGTHVALTTLANATKRLENDIVMYRSNRDAALQARDEIYAAVGGQEGGYLGSCTHKQAVAFVKEKFADLRTALAAAQENVGKVTATKDAAYHERDQVVAALAALAAISGWPVWRATHVGPWEDDWRNIIFISTPHGQVSWHYHDSERDLFSMHKSDQSTLWDGHSTEEKYARLSRLSDDARRAAVARGKDATNGED